MSHPYVNAPNSAFWSRAVASNFTASSLVRAREPLIRKHECVATAGSCFASNLVPYLERNGFIYLRTEKRHRAIHGIPPENLGYDKFSVAYGNIYTVRQLLQLLRRCQGRFNPLEDRWETKAGVIDPFRPGLKYHALNNIEFDLLTAQHLRAVRAMFEKTDVFIFTLGLTEAWESKLDGAVFPACPGTVNGIFDPTKHGFVNFTVGDIDADLDMFLTEFKSLNSRVRVILTVSPVPLVATGTVNHVLTASTYSKSVLRVVAEQATVKHPFVTYFPAYEIVTGPQAPADFFEADFRNVSSKAVETVMGSFLANCEQDKLASSPTSHLNKPATPDPAVRTDEAGEVDERQQLSKLLVQAECEEAMADAKS